MADLRELAHRFHRSTCIVERAVRIRLIAPPFTAVDRPLATALARDVAKDWTPTVNSYLGRVAGIRAIAVLRAIAPSGRDREFHPADRAQHVVVVEIRSQMNIADPVGQQVRRLDRIVDEPATGKSLENIKRDRAGSSAR